MPTHKTTSSSARQRVKAVHPEARECYTRSGEKAVGVGLNTILGMGRTWRAAWEEAAKELK